MEEYISSLRRKGYSDWIQVFRIIEKYHDGKEIISWVKMDKPLSVQLNSKENLILTEITQSFDKENQLDYLDFIFKPKMNNQIVVKESRVDSNESFHRQKEYYWKPIRKIIGSEKILAVGVNAFIQNDKGQIATVKRKDDGNWSFPAGAREIGELPAESIVNEVKEETSLITEVDKLCCLYTVHLTYPNGDIYDYLIALYKMNLIEGKLTVNDDENIDAKWMDIEEAENLFNGGWKKRLLFYSSYKDEDGVIIL